MTTNVFLMLLFVFSTLSSLITEGIKKMLGAKITPSYNIVALVVALIVGAVGCYFYYQFNEICFNINNIIYMILMGLASGLTSMVGFDKVKQALIQCGLIKEVG